MRRGRGPVTHYYVWYRVAGDAGEARRAVDAVMRDVVANAGVSGRMLIRRDDPRTWMEIYENVGDAKRFEEKLDNAVMRHGFARFVEGGKRQVEPFISPG